MLPVLNLDPPRDDSHLLVLRRLRHRLLFVPRGSRRRRFIEGATALLKFNSQIGIPLRLLLEHLSTHWLPLMAPNWGGRLFFSRDSGALIKAHLFDQIIFTKCNERRRSAPFVTLDILAFVTTDKGIRAESEIYSPSAGNTWTNAHLADNKIHFQPKLFF